MSDLPISPSKIRCHLDASDDSTFTVVDGRVAEWRSKVGSFHFAQSNATYRPERVASGVRFWFDGSHPVYTPRVRYLSRPSPVINAYPGDVFVVADSITMHSGYQGVFLAVTESSVNYVWVSDVGVVSRRTTYQETAHGADWSNGARRIISGTFRATQHVVRVNNNAPTVATITNQSNPSGTSYLGLERVSSSIFSANHLDGIIREVVVAQGLDETERKVILGFLGSRWGLGPPIGGRVIELPEYRPPRVVVFNWVFPAHHIKPIVQEDGTWSAFWFGDMPYGVYYLSRDGRAPPLVEGPYTVE